MTHAAAICKHAAIQAGFASLQIFAVPLQGGARAAGLFNRCSNTTQPGNVITVRWQNLGYPPEIKAVVRDVYAQQDIGTFTKAFSAVVELQDAQMFKITPIFYREEYDRWQPWPED